MNILCSKPVQLISFSITLCFLTLLPYVHGQSITDPSLLYVDSAYARDQSPDMNSAEKTEPTTKGRYDESAIVPGVTYSPMLKTGALAVWFRMYQKEEDTDPRLLSFQGGGVSYFSSKSYGAGYFDRRYLKKGKYRVDFGVGGAEIRNDFYGFTLGLGSGGPGWAKDPVDMESKVLGAAANFGLRVSKFAYAGAGMVSYQAETRGADLKARLRLLLNGFSEETYKRHSMKLFYSYDSRTNPQNPDDGMSLELAANLYRESFGENTDFETFEIKMGRYVAVKPDHERTLAYRATGKFCSSDTPVDMYQFYGVTGEQRGYVGKHYGKDLFHIEAELRQEFTKKLGAVVFLGIGKSFGGGGFFESVSDAEWLPNYGFGFRYKVLPEKDLNARLDFGFGKDDEFTMYFGIGETF